MKSLDAISSSRLVVMSEFVAVISVHACPGRMSAEAQSKKQGGC